MEKAFDTNTRKKVTQQRSTALEKFQWGMLPLVKKTQDGACPAFQVLC